MTVPTALTNNWQAVPIRRRIKMSLLTFGFGRRDNIEQATKAYNKNEIVCPDVRFYEETDRFIKSIHVRHSFPKRKVMNKTDKFR